MKHRTVEEEIIKSNNALLRIKKILNKQSEELRKLVKQDSLGYSRNEANALFSLFSNITTEIFLSPSIGKLSDLHYNQIIGK